MEIKTFDVVNMIAAEAQERYAVFGYKLNQKKTDLIQNSCSIIDYIIDECNCESVQASFDDYTLELTVSVECVDIVFENGRKHPFFDLIQNTKAFKFESTGELIKLSFVFDGLWVS